VRILRPPTALLALEEAEAGAGEGAGVSLRLTQCVVHASGALLLEPQDGALYDRRLRATMRPPQPRGALDAPGHGAANVGGPDELGCEPGDAGNDHLEDCDGEDGGDWGQDDGDEWDGGDIDLPDATGGAAGRASHPEPDQMLTGLSEELPEGQSEHLHQLQQQQQSEVRQRRDGGMEEQPRMEHFDPYKPLDYADKNGLPVRPVQVRWVEKLCMGSNP